jgi:hypothetical protein
MKKKSNRPLKAAMVKPDLNRIAFDKQPTDTQGRTVFEMQWRSKTVLF